MTMELQGRAPVASPLRAGFGFGMLGAAVGAPALLVLWLSFDHGGNPPGTASLAAAMLAVMLALRIAFAPETLRRPSRVGTVAIAALAGFAAWTVASAAWSHAPDPAVADGTHALLYVMVFVTTATLPPGSMRWTLYALAATLSLVGTIAFLSRVLPELVHTPLSAAEGRLHFPIGYWNALALMLSTALVLNVHLASNPVEPRTVRAAAAALLPILSSALYLTGSRGAIGAALLGLLAYAVLGRPRGLPAALLALALPLIVTLGATYASSALFTWEWRTGAGTAQGHRLLAVVAACSAVAALLRLRLEILDRHVVRMRLPRPSRRTLAVATTLVVAALAAVGLTVDAPAQIKRQYHAFLGSGPVATSSDPRGRVTDVYNNGRVDQWRIAFQSFKRQPLQGEGAGTFVHAWDRSRPDLTDVPDVHSVYFKAAGELGIVGLALFLGWLAATFLAGFRASRSMPPSGAAMAAVVLTWAVDVAVEWTWDIPAATVAPIALGAAAVGLKGREGRLGRPARALAALACIALAVPMGGEGLSQSRIEAATLAYNVGDCTVALDDARVAAAAAPWSADPHVIRALCAVRASDRVEAIGEMDRALARDPENWTLRFDKALVLGATGGDPRAALTRAVSVNPLDGDLRFLEYIVGRWEPPAWPRVFRAMFPFVDQSIERPVGPDHICPRHEAARFRWTTWTYIRCKPSTGTLLRLGHRL
jgi:O-antigen ligase